MVHVTPVHKNYYPTSSNPPNNRQSARLLFLIIISSCSIAQKPDTTKATRTQIINKSIELYNALELRRIKKCSLTLARILLS